VSRLSAEEEYALGTDQVEAARLGFQHQVWSAPTTSAWERAGFKPGDALLDVGCGPGYATLDLARLVGPTGSVLGVDLSRRFLDHLEGRARAGAVGNVRTLCAAAETMEVGESWADGAFARWVLCFSPDPAAIVSQATRALKPGGRFVVLDYANYEAFSIFPRSPVIDHVVLVITKAFRGEAREPDVGAVLPRLMLDVGLLIQEVRPLIRLARPGTALWQWPDSFFRSYLPRLEAQGGITAEQHEAFMEAWEVRSLDPAAFLLTPAMVSVIGVKPGG
jgi:ubiquinone/menaquinone biosynthesis C-methylase UbiE